MAIPSDLIGINAQDWPHIASPAPAFNFGHYATIDNQRLHWRFFNPSSGSYSWANWDTLVAATGAKSILYVHIGTPTWQAQAADVAVVGPYGGAGEMSMPTNLALMQTALAQLTSRYSQIKVVQAGNEPTYTGNGAPLSTFWWGTAAQLVDYVYYTILGAKSGNPNVKVISPAVYTAVMLTTFLDATGPNCGLKGSQLPLDGLCLHPYMAYPNLRSGGMDLNTLYIGGITAFTKLLTDRGMAPLPIYMSEYAPASSASHVRDVEFKTVFTAAKRREVLGRLGVAAARNGVKMLSYFSFGSASALCGDMNEANGPGYGIGDAHNAVAGKTLLAGAGYTVFGVEQGSCSDDTSYSI